MLHIDANWGGGDDVTMKKKTISIFLNRWMISSFAEIVLVISHISVFVVSGRLYDNQETVS